jgi:hypothetical protein
MPTLGSKSKVEISKRVGLVSFSAWLFTRLVRIFVGGQLSPVGNGTSAPPVKRMWRENGK